MDDQEKKFYEALLKDRKEREETIRYETVAWTLIALGAGYLVFFTDQPAFWATGIAPAGNAVAKSIVSIVSAIGVLLLVQKAIYGRTWILGFQEWRAENRARNVLKARANAKNKVAGKDH